MLSDFFPADVTPYAGLSAAAIAIVFVSHFFGFFIRGAFGFGSNLPIVLITTWLLGPHHAILLVLLMSVVAQIHLLPQGVRSADWEVARPLMVGMVIGGGLGTWLFTALTAGWLTLIMGVLIAVILALDRWRVLERIDRATMRAPAVSTALAALSGAAGSVSGGGAIYFLVVYLKLACATPALLRGTNMVLAALLMGSRIVFVVIAGLISPTLVAEAALLVPVVFLGTWTGTRLFHAASTERFYAWLQILLFAAALAIIVRGIVRVA